MRGRHRNVNDKEQSLQESDPDVLRSFIVQENWVLQPHVEVAEDFLLNLTDVCRSLDQLCCETLLSIKLFFLSRLKQVWIVLVVEQLLYAKQEGGQLQLCLVAKVLVLSLRLGHFLWVVSQTLYFQLLKLALSVVLS